MVVKRHMKALDKAKYNQLIRIEEQLGASAHYAGAAAFRRG